MTMWLIPLVFFTALLGGLVPGFLVLTLWGGVQTWRLWRSPGLRASLAWGRADTALALSFMGIVVFKMLTLLWSDDPLGVAHNVAWHLYFLFWPLVFLGLWACPSPTARVEQATAWGLLLTTGVAAVLQARGGHINALGNVGILAQLVMVLGGWMGLVWSRPDQGADGRRWLFGLAWVACWVLLVMTSRRLELLGFVVLTAVLLVLRYGRRFSRSQWAWMGLLLCGLMALVVGLRWERFATGWSDVALYFADGVDRDAAVSTSWGARLEMWRLTWVGWREHPWLGWSASARPYLMPGAPPIEIFGHRHFHGHWAQTLAEGGLLGVAVLLLSLAVAGRLLVVQAWQTHAEWARLALAVGLAYTLEGLASATLVYDKPNALLVIVSAWLWVQVRGAASLHRAQKAAG